MAKTASIDDCDLENFVKNYPALFSQKRLDEWQALFDDRAMVIRLQNGCPTTCMNIRNALPEQYEYAHENSTFTEEWAQPEIRRYGNIAVIKAAYSLTTDHEIRKGTDVLTLIRHENEWRIIGLVYEQTEFVAK